MKIDFLTIEAYKVGGNGRSDIAKKISLSPYLNTKAGDRYYEARMDNGCILLIPEKEYNKVKKSFEKK